jgi:hypothetical protein
LLLLDKSLMEFWNAIEYLIKKSNYFNMHVWIYIYISNLNFNYS